MLHTMYASSEDKDSSLYVADVGAYYVGSFKKLKSAYDSKRQSSMISGYPEQLTHIDVMLCHVGVGSTRLPLTQCAERDANMHVHMDKLN